MALTVGELVAFITADRSGFRRGVRESRDDLAGLQRDANGRLHDLKGRFVAEGRAAGEGLGRGFLRAHPMLRKLADGIEDVLEAAAKGALVSVLGTAAAGVVPHVLALVGAVAPAAGAIALLPGLAAGAAGALGVLKLATVGLGDAFKAALAGDAAKFAETLEQLSPEARALAQEVRRLQPALDGLRRSVQDSVFRGMGLEVRALAQTWLPVLQDRLTAIGSAFGAAFRAAAEAARSSVVVEGVTAALDSAHLALARLNDEVGGLIKGFGAAAGVAAPFLDRVGILAAQAAKAFGTWLQEAAKSGRLTEILDAAFETLEQLAGIIGEVGRLFGNVFSAAQASGGGLLNNLRMLLKSVNAFLSSAEGKTALQDFFSATTSVLRALLPTLKILASTFGSTLAPAIAQVAQVLAPVVQMVAGALAQALKAIAPVLPLLAAQFAALVAAVAPLIPPLGELVAQLITALLPVLDPIIALVGEVAVALKDGLMAAMVALLPHTQEIFAALGELLRALIPLIPPLAELAVALIPLIALWAEFQATILRLVVPILATVIGWIAKLISWVVDKLVPALAELVRRTRRSWEEIKQAIAAAVDRIISIIDWFRGLPGRLGDWFARARDAAVDKMAGLVEWLRGLPGRILRAVGDLGRLLFGAGQDVVRGLWSGIQSSGGWLAGQIMGWVRSVIPDPVERLLGIGSPSKLMMAIGRFVAEGLARGIFEGGGLVAAASGQLAAQVATQMGGLQQAARELLRRVTSGGSFFEDFSFAGMSSVLGQYNDQLAQAFFAQRPGADFGSRGTTKAIEQFLKGVAANPAGRGVNVENLNVRAYSDRFSLRQVMEDVYYSGVR